MLREKLCPFNWEKVIVCSNMAVGQRMYHVSSGMLRKVSFSPSPSPCFSPTFCASLPLSAPL